jgi:hypothetical protein
MKKYRRKGTQIRTDRFIFTADIKSPVHKERTALVRPQAAHGKPVRITKGQTVVKKYIAAIQYKIRSRIGIRRVTISFRIRSSTIVVFRKSIFM